jgi:SAM-dependent methyltransferase
VSWQLFEPRAAGYASWYAKGRGARVSRAEQRLLDRLLAAFPSARTGVEVGCGTGHFTRWLNTRLSPVVGLERSPAMLAVARWIDATLPVVQSDAHCLPFGDRSVDLLLFVTALEFLDDAEEALAEAVRVARQGLVLVVLNRWSAAGASRRWGAQSRKPILGQAHDYTLPGLRKMLARAAGARLQRVTWRSAMFPGPLVGLQAPVPLGEVLGLAAVLRRTDREREAQVRRAAGAGP